jgi:hypothetical protein
MIALGQLGKRILSEGTPAMLARAQLLGMDEGYLAGLHTLGQELEAAERELGALTAQGGISEDDIAHQAGLTLHLMMHVIECFEAAHEIDSNVPRLRPSHTARLVHRLSKLPPPPPPGGLALCVLCVLECGGAK